jgi:hypothetical protein
MGGIAFTLTILGLGLAIDGFLIEIFPISLEREPS